MNRWLDKYDTMSDKDHDALEAEAAVYEFQNGVPRERAESLAHSNYKRKSAISAAAHHLLGMKAALASGSHSGAAQHGKMYHAAMTAAGFNPIGQIPDEIKDAAKEISDLYSFKPHPSDGFFAEKVLEAGNDDKNLEDAIAKLNKLKEVLA